MADKAPKTAFVQYTGRDDIRVLDAHDLRHGGVEAGFHKTAFNRGVPTEVPADAADALVSNSHIFGTFEYIDVVRDAPEETDEKTASK